MLTGLRELPGSVVVTVGRDLDPAASAHSPPTCTCIASSRSRSLLPHCDLVVSHAGSGSVIGALAHGLPMVLLPMGADQPLNAARAEALGVAQVLDALEATPAEIQRAAVVVMSEAGYRRNAGLIRDEIRALPGPERAVELIEQLG